LGYYLLRSKTLEGSYCSAPVPFAGLEDILDYKPGGTYTYKGAQFIVEKADSTHISFTILRPL